MTQVDIHKTVHSRAPRIPFSRIASEILGDDYTLSLVLIGDALGKRLNSEYKGRNYPTNVLSFPLSEDAGEIFINVRKAEREAKRFSHTPREHIQYLFIHGCLHLAGYNHGSTMEELEQKYMTKAW